MRTAKAASMPAILVSFGYAAPPLDDFAPETVIDHFDELLPCAVALLDGPATARVRA